MSYYYQTYATQPTGLEPPTAGAQPAANAKSWYVNVSINGSAPLTFAFDTGTVITTLTSEMASKANLGKVVRTDSFISGGKSAQEPIYRVTMKIGDGAPFPAEVAVSTGANRGLLSTLDFMKSGMSFVIGRGGSRIVRRGASIVAPAFAVENNRFFMPIKINNRPLRINYDSGATITFINAKDAQATGIANLKPAGTTRSRSATGGLSENPLLNVTMQIGTTAPFQTQIAFQPQRPRSTLSGADVLKSGHSVVLGTNPLYVPHGTRVVAPVQASYEEFVPHVASIDETYTTNRVPMYGYFVGAAGPCDVLTGANKAACLKRVSASGGVPRSSSGGGVGGPTNRLRLAAGRGFTPLKQIPVPPNKQMLMKCVQAVTQQWEPYRNAVMRQLAYQLGVRLPSSGFIDSRVHAMMRVRDEELGRVLVQKICQYCSRYGALAPPLSCTTGIISLQPFKPGPAPTMGGPKAT